MKLKKLFIAKILITIMVLSIYSTKGLSANTFNYSKIAESQHFMVYSDISNVDGYYYSRCFELMYQRRGLLKEFINLRLTTSKSDQEIITSVFKESSLAIIDAQWRVWLRKQMNDPGLSLVKVSFIQKSKAQFANWVKENRLIWDNHNQMYVIN